jgi:hypothetical protein
MRMLAVSASPSENINFLSINPNNLEVFDLPLN